jgi:hypothetical protein
MPASYRLSNWSEYNRALVLRGNVTLWLSEEAIAAWEYNGPPQHGAQYTYSAVAIEACLTLRAVYHLALRQTQGFVNSLLGLMGVDVPVPNYSTLSRRADDLSVCLSKRSGGGGGEGERDEPRHIVIDSTGLKVYGDGEWKQRAHGKSKRRTWRKLHLALDPETGEITATELTDNATDDASQVEPLLNETEGPIETVGGDGAYDKWKSYEAISAVGARPVIPPQKNAKIKRHGNTAGPPLPRDETLRYMRRHGRKEWKRASGYHRRSLSETGMYRFKQIVGRVLRSRTLARQKTEARIGSKVLNVMLGLGRPVSYAVAMD